MRRLLLVFVVLICTIRPAYADDVAAQQDSVRQQLAAAAAQITDLNFRIANLEQSVADTQRRVDRERDQVRLLARALYAQPDSLLSIVFESASVSEALTRIADLTSAGDRAAATKHQLDIDLAMLSAQRNELRADLERQQGLKKQLEDRYAKLAVQAAAQRGPVPPAPPTRVAPGSVGAIQQIILDAFAPLGSAAQTWAIRVAGCESQYNPYAVNKSSGAAGLFQFLPSTWASTPQHAQSVFDPVANSQAAAWLYSRSGPGQWQCK